MKKPPIGITPRWLVTEARLTALKGAIERYEEAGLEANKEWHEEFYELEYYIKLHRLNLTK